MKAPEIKFEPYNGFDLDFYTQEHFDQWSKTLGVEARMAVRFIGMGEEELSAAFAKDPELLTHAVECMTETIAQMDGLKSVLDTAVARIIFVGERLVATG